MIYDFYLAHPFDSRKEIRKWELSVEKSLGYTICNPFYDITREDVADIDAGKKGRYDVNFSKLVERDIKSIKVSNKMINIIDGSFSYGTIQEMVYGKLFGKEVLSVVSNGHEEHPWLKYHSNKIFKSLDDLYCFLAEEKLYNKWRGLLLVEERW